MSQSNYTKADYKDAALQPPAGTPSPQPAPSGKPRSRRWTSALAIAGALVLVIALLLYGSGVYIVSSMFSQRVEKLEYTPEALGLTAETLNLQSSDGIPLKAWWLPVPEPRGVVVLLHGMEGMDASSLLPRARLLGPEGYACLALDMRAHGRSGGERIALAFEEPRDVSAALDWIQSQPDLRDLPVTLLGISMGGSTAIRTAASRPDVDAVISVSSYDSVDHMIEQGMRLMGAPEWLIPIYSPFIRLGILTVYGVWPATASPRHDIARIPPRPVLIIHGDADDQVPVEQAHRLVEASDGQAEIWIVVGGSHGVYSTEFEGDQDLEYRQRILTFLQNNVIH